MGRVVGRAVGDKAAPGNASTAMASTAALGESSFAGGYVQGVHGHSLPRAFLEEELHEADPQLQKLTATDWQLLGIFGDTIHLNDGTLLNSGIGTAKDAMWQRLYNHATPCSLPLYVLPNG
jgi:hypothetical protein